MMYVIKRIAYRNFYINQEGQEGQGNNVVYNVFDDVGYWRGSQGTLAFAKDLIDDLIDEMAGCTSTREWYERQTTTTTTRKE